MDTKEKINQIFMNLQHLQIQPTETNLQILLAAMYGLKEIYGQMKVLEEENTELKSGKDPDEGAKCDE